MPLERVTECFRDVVETMQARRVVRAETRRQRRLIRQHRRELQICSATCRVCNRQLRVTPAQLARSDGRSDHRSGAEHVTSTFDGIFRCPCGALGWMRGGPCILAPREAKEPSAIQRRCLEALTGGEQLYQTLAEDFDLDDPTTLGELALAEHLGWITTSLGGIGGLFARPSPSAALTNRGRDALARG